MKNTENKIRNLLSKAKFGIKPHGTVKCDIADGVAGYTGSITSGLFKKNHDAITALESAKSSDGNDLSDHLLELREESRQETKGPIYRCNINIDSKDIEFEYFWEGEDFDSLSEIEPTIDGALPSFVFEKMLTEEIISFIDNYQIDSAIFFFVPAQKARGSTIHERLLDMYALIDWQSDTDNGGLNQYFARDNDYFNCYPRDELYPRVLSAIEYVGHKQSAKLYKEAIALYSHFYDRVENARQIMNIPPIPKQDESDITDRYFEICGELESARRTFVKEHADEYASRS